MFHSALFLFRSDEKLIANRAHFLSQPFARQRLLDTLFLARFQVERVFFDVLNDVFLLHLSFEAP